MKKISLIAAAVLASVSLAACGNSASQHKAKRANSSSKVVHHKHHKKQQHKKRLPVHHLAAVPVFHRLIINSRSSKASKRNSPVSSVLTMQTLLWPLPGPNMVTKTAGFTGVI